MRLVVDRIRDAEARAMADHLRARHPELHLRETTALGELLDHFGVTPTENKTLVKSGSLDVVRAGAILAQRY